MNLAPEIARLSNGDAGGLPRLDRLVSPLGGVVSNVSRLPNSAGEPYFPVYCAHLGDLSRSIPNVRASTNGESVRDKVDGAGGSIDAEVAARVCVAEALERYSSAVFTEDQFIWAAAEDLGADALDLDELPACSATELADPRCPVRPPDKRAPIRWVRGFSLTRRVPVWVPAVLVYMYIRPMSVGEAFALPISTGCAGHFNLSQALVSALCEVIERDAIALTWLQRLPLPEIELDAVPAQLAPYLERLLPADVEVHFFDATSDLGVPTVYSVDLSPQNAILAQLVMCVTHVDPLSAIAKSLRESASSRIAMHVKRGVPEALDDFFDVYHGAAYMGRPERRDAFEFLLSSVNRTRLSEMPSIDQGSPEANLRLLLARVAGAGMEAIAVEVTTDEMLQVGFRVVRVIVPQLQPLSFARRAQYRAHPRLYWGPAAMGYPVHAEEELNAWPQPFA